MERERAREAEVEMLSSECEKLAAGLQDGLSLHRILRDESGVPRDCRILAVNPAFERLVGVEKEQVRDKSVRKILPELDRVWTRILQSVKSAGNSERAEFVDTVFHTECGGRIFTVTAYSPEKDFVVVTFTDVTERNREREEYRRLQSQLIQAQKMEAIGRLAGGVAHDFNNLLTALQGYADLALMQFGNEAIVKESLEQIRKATERAAKLSHQLLIFSRKQPMELKPKNVNEIITNLGDMLKRIIGETISIEFDLEPDVWVARVNLGQIEQVVMNLAVNARDAMPEGGKLKIKTNNVQIDDKYCESYSYARPGFFICLSVEDTGVGMDRETMNSIFEPFFTTKKSGVGTGLGLSVVYGIVEEHGGWINVYSEKGTGSVFKIFLPACREQAVQVERCAQAVADLRGNGERILLVEDEKIILDFMRKRLAEEGYVVFGAENVGEALRIFDAENSSFDLLFTDVVLPDRTGIELIEKLHSRNPKLKVLITSGYFYTQSEWPSLDTINVQFIQKPYTVNGLLLAIRSNIDQVRIGEG